MSALLLSKRLLRAAAPIGLSIAYISSNVRQSHTLGAAGLNDRPTFEACPEIACKGKEELAAMFGEQALRRPRKISSVSSNAGEKMGSSSSAASSEYASQSSTSAFSSAKATFPCPPNREELGNHSWHLLHTIAAYYPDHPSAEDKQAAAGLVHAIAQLYPCKHCRAAFKSEIADSPPRLGSRAEFSLWMCDQHNRVNAALGRKKFDCELAVLDERWRTGRLECWVDQAQNAAESLGQDDDGTAEQ